MRKLTIKRLTSPCCGICDSADLNCGHGGCDGPLTLEIDGKRFCSERCANDYYLEGSEGSYQPFPQAQGALSDEQIQDNQREWFDRYEREHS